MRNVDIKARVANVFDTREFEKGGKKGVVSGMLLSDDTGTIRLPLWNDETELIKTVGISQGDLIEVSGAWSKKDNYRDTAELRLGKRGRITKLEDGQASDIEAARGDALQGQARQEAVRADIEKLVPGMNAIVTGCFVQAYRKKPYYESCPQCGGRVEESSGTFTCKEHGSVQPAYNVLLSGVIDDGTGNIRVVFFREQAENVFGMKADEVKNAFMSQGLDSFWEGFKGIGKNLSVEGRVKINDFSKEAEIVANSVSDVDAGKDAERLLAEVES